MLNFASKGEEMNSDFLKQLGKLTDEEVEFINRWRNLTDEQKEKFLNLLQIKTDESEMDE